MRAIATEEPRLIKGSGLHFTYRSRNILTDANIVVGGGEVVSLLGANGAGKSTLLRLLLGLLTPSQGKVCLCGSSLMALSRREIAQKMAYVPQVHVTPFPYTVREVVMLGRLPDGGLFRSPSHQDREIVETVLQRFNITHLAARSYTEISGGERQLTLIARALAQQARILIMDEPMTGLDYGYQISLIEHLRSLASDGHAVIMSTHDPQFASIASTRIAVLAAGHIVADDIPERAITPYTIKQIYGVDVESQKFPGGGRAFIPLSLLQERQHAGSTST